MALDNAQLKEFCNDELRQIADLQTWLNIRIAAAVAEYYARNLGGIIDSGGAGNSVLDGSLTDGRTIVVGGDVYNFVTLLEAHQVFMTQERRDVLAKWNVNGNKGQLSGQS